MNPKVLSIFNNAKIFLSENEMKELAIGIEKEYGKPQKIAKKQIKKDNVWTIEEVTEMLLANQFNKNRRKK